MRVNILIYLSVIFLIISCSCSKTPDYGAEIDDSVIAEKDVLNYDTEREDLDTVDEYIEDFSINDYNTDIDSNPANDREIPDHDTYCPPPPYAGYPYKKEDGTLHFCRKCDTPTEYDPQCVTSLWKDINDYLFETYPDEECHPYPCDWTSMQPITPEEYSHGAIKMHQCDLRLNNKGWWNLSLGNRKVWLEDGKVGMWLYKDDWDNIPYYPDDFHPFRTIQYNIEEKTYKVIGLSGEAYYNDGLFLSQFSRAIGWLESYIIISYPYKDSYRYEAIYTDEDNSMGFWEEPAVGEKWVALNIDHFIDGRREVEGSIIYSKKGDWKWHKLGSGRMRTNSDIVGDYLLFSDNNYQLYLCDLSKFPESFADCDKLSGSDEIASSPMFDKANPSRILYRSKVSDVVVIVDISKKPFSYQNIKIKGVSENYAGIVYPTWFDGNVIMYGEALGEIGDADTRLCMYRIDEEKSYCFDAYREGGDYDFMGGMFEGRYTVWWGLYKGIFLRDMKCYCEQEPDNCPFDEYRSKL